MNKYTERLYNGIWKENPIFVQILGMSPTLAVTTSAMNGLGMGLSSTVVLVAANFIISLMRSIIPGRVRLPGEIVVVASLVTIVDMLMEGFTPDLYSAEHLVQCSSHDKGKDVKAACQAGCIGCTLCTKQCESDAIHMDNNLAFIDYEKCTNCGKCAAKCPAKVIL